MAGRPMAGRSADGRGIGPVSGPVLPRMAGSRRLARGGVPVAYHFADGSTAVSPTHRIVSRHIAAMPLTKRDCT
jgi:hypothetical protein